MALGGAPPPEKRRRAGGEIATPPSSEVPRLSLHPPQSQAKTGLHPGPQLHSPALHPPSLSVPKAGFKASSRLAPSVTYRAECILGKGSFGVVYKAMVANTTHAVAIKAVKQRMGDVNVEDQVLRKLRGSPNIVNLLGTFPTGRGEDHMLNLVLEYISDTLQRIIKHHRQLATWMELQYVRLYTYQILRGLACLDRHRIVHRDLKPANLLVEPTTKTLKVCDFGTAKFLDGGRGDNQPYVCSRYYRAPELILSTPEYGTAVDLWSAGCVLAEMLVGQPLFAGRDGVDQLAQIVEILGTPTAEEFYAMNPQYDASVGFRDRIQLVPWDRVLKRKVGHEVVELLGKLLQYDPSLRPLPLHCLASPVFDPLRQCAGQLDPALFYWTAEELAGCPRELQERLLSGDGGVLAGLPMLTAGPGTWGHHQGQAGQPHTPQQVPAYT